MAKPVCVIVGVGPGNGAALARRFSEEGHTTALLARNVEYLDELRGEIEDSHAYSCDVTDPTSITSAFQAVQSDLGGVDVLIYNAGSGQWGDVEEVSAEDFEQAWKVNARGLLLSTKEVLPTMLDAGRGSIVVIGATASLRGGAQFAAFASAKAAQRSLAQSMARHLGPKGIHVSLVIIDGVIDLPRTRARMPDRSDEFFLKPDHIAETAYFLTQQQPSAWSFEVDVRPAGENW